jgi:hypothetical protein
VFCVCFDILLVGIFSPVSFTAAFPYLFHYPLFAPHTFSLHLLLLSHYPPFAPLPPTFRSSTTHFSLPHHPLFAPPLPTFCSPTTHFSLPHHLRFAPSPPTFRSLTTHVSLPHHSLHPLFASTRRFYHVLFVSHHLLASPSPNYSFFFTHLAQHVPWHSA